MIDTEDTRIIAVIPNEFKEDVDMELVAAWIDALESGNYDQTKSKLNASGGYCCLGVACDVAIKMHKVEGEWQRSHDATNVNDFVFKDDGMSGREDALLPDPVRRLLGMATGEGALLFDNSRVIIEWHKDESDRYSIASTLTYANDSLSWTFAEIARALRRAYGIPKA